MKFMLALLAVLATTPAAQAGLVETMKRYEGLHESTNNKALRKMLGVNPRAVPWCGYMLAYVARKNGRKPPASFASARAWAKYGKYVQKRELRRSDVLVIITGRRQLHAGTFTKRVGAKVCLIGGNTSNRVKESCYPARNIYAARR
jgi:uncharacterized protein (TIGR02594 family)